MPGALSGLTVLIPRGGALGERLAAAVSGNGGTAMVAPIIDFAEPADARPIADACERLNAGEFDWLAVTSATTVEVLRRHNVQVPDATRVAGVGPATRQALADAGISVDFVPASAYSAAAMVAEWPDPRGRVLLPQSAIAEPTLADGLAGLGMQVTVVSAYQTTILDWGDEVTQRLGRGEFDAVLLTSSSMARAVAARWPRHPEYANGTTVVACIGENSAAAARSAGLEVAVVAHDATAVSLVESLCHYVTARTNPSSRTT